MKKIILTTMLILSVSAFRDNDAPVMNHMNMQNMQSNDTMLTEAGNDAFGTIQEVIRKLNANPNTD
jgi:hypothetical protein